VLPSPCRLDKTCRDTRKPDRPFWPDDCVEFRFHRRGHTRCWTPVADPWMSLIRRHEYLASCRPQSEWRQYPNLRRWWLGWHRRLSTGTYGNSAFPFNIGGGGIFDCGDARMGIFSNGQIDEVIAVQRALTTTEITSLYQCRAQCGWRFGCAVCETDVGPIMSNINATAYIRLPFTVTDPSSVPAHAQDALCRWIHCLPQRSRAGPG